MKNITYVKPGSWLADRSKTNILYKHKMSLPAQFAILGPLSDPDFDIVEDYSSLPDMFEVMEGPKYLLMCTASQDVVQTINFIESTEGEISLAKKVLSYPTVTTNIHLKQNPFGKQETIQFKKTNMFLSRETITKGFTTIPIYTLLTRKEMWYFPVEKKFKRSLTVNENRFLREGPQV